MRVIVMRGLLILVLVGLFASPAGATQKQNEANFFADKNQVNLLIGKTLELGQMEGVIGLTDFAVEAYNKAVNGNTSAAHATIFAKMSWYSLSWAMILLSHDKLASQEQFSDIGEKLSTVGELFGWSEAQTMEMFKQTRVRFNEYIK